MSTEPIQVLMSRVMADVGGVAKKDKNTAQNFSFRGIDAVVNAVAPVLQKHGVVVSPTVLDFRYDTVEVGRNRTQMGHVIATVMYAFHGPAGDVLEATVIGEAMDSGDKAVPKAMSVAFRTALLQALALPTDEPDPDASSYERSEAKPVANSDQVQGFMTAMTAATNLAMLDMVAKQAASFTLTEGQRSALKSHYLSRKSTFSEDTLGTHQTVTDEEISV